MNQHLSGPVAPPADRLAPTERSFGHQLRQANRLSQRDLTARVARMGLTVGQWYILRTLWENDRLTQVELAEQSGMVGPAVVATIRSLLAQGLVTRSRPKSDRRKYLITLTPAGQALRAQALQASIESNAVALEGISPEALEIAIGVLHRVFANLQSNALAIPEPPSEDC